MVQTENKSGYKIAPVESRVFNGLYNHIRVQPIRLDRGSCYSLSPLDYIEAIQDKGIQQIKSIEASGSNDLTVSTIDLILLSAEVEMRGSKFRGFPQLSSQTI